MRDKAHRAKFSRLGWSVLTIWECELRKSDKLTKKLLLFMKS